MRELRDQYLNCFVALVESSRDNGDLTASAAYVMLEAAESMTDIDSRVTLDHWWEEVAMVAKGQWVGGGSYGSQVVIADYGCCCLQLLLPKAHRCLTCFA